MNKEEKEIIQKEIDNKHLETQGYGRNLFVCKIVELERYIETLQSQLDTANKKLDEIEGYAKLRNDELNDFKKSTINDSFNVNIEKFIKDILSIMGSNNIQKCSLYNTDLKSYTDNKTQTIGGE